MLNVFPRSARRPAGFTLVEIWVGLLITVAIAGVSLAAFRGQTKLATVRRVRDGVVADLRTMQQWSLAGKTTSVCAVGALRVCPSDGSCACSTAVPAGGYGAYFTPCTASGACRYELFADLNGDQKMNYVDANGNQRYDAGESSGEMLSGGIHTLERPATIARLEPAFQGCFSSGSESWSSVAFAPYHGGAALAGSSQCSSYVVGIRQRETVTLGPSIFGSADQQFTIYRGSGGIQEQDGPPGSPSPSPS